MMECYDDEIIMESNTEYRNFNRVWFNILE